MLLWSVTWRKNIRRHSVNIIFRILVMSVRHRTESDYFLYQRGNHLKKPCGTTFGWSVCQVTRQTAAERPVVTNHRPLRESGLKALFAWHSPVLSPGFWIRFKQWSKWMGSVGRFKPRLTAAFVMSLSDWGDCGGSLTGGEAIMCQVGKQIISCWY